MLPCCVQMQHNHCSHQVRACSGLARHGSWRYYNPIFNTNLMDLVRTTYSKLSLKLKFTRAVEINACHTRIRCVHLVATLHKHLLLLPYQTLPPLTTHHTSVSNTTTVHKSIMFGARQADNVTLDNLFAICFCRIKPWPSCTIR